MKTSQKWHVEEISPHFAHIVTPGGYRVARMTIARAHGIVAALNTGEGRAAFLKAVYEHNTPIKEK